MALMNTNKILPIIQCAKCNKSVDRIEKEECSLSLDTRYIVYCHGDREEVRLSKSLIEDSLSIEPGVAFAHPLIENSAETI